MRRFQFRLERFLELRRWKEREWEIALAKILGECLLMERRIAEIAVEIGASMFSGFVTGGRVDIEAMARRELYVQRLARERERTRESLVERRKELEKVRAKYLEAARDRKVLDKLKERRSEEYYDRQIDEEFKTIDDMNTSAASSRPAAAGKCRKLAAGKCRKLAAGKCRKLAAGKCRKLAAGKCRKLAAGVTGRGAVAEFTEVRPGVRIFILFLLLIVLTLGGVIWFDYLGLVDAKSLLAPVYSLIGVQKRSMVANADDPNLLDRERLAKQEDALTLRQQDLDARETALSQKEKQLNQLGADLNDKDAALTAREKAFNDRVKALDNRNVNLTQNATYLTNMPPANSVAILLKMGDQDIIDLMRIVEQQAKAAGTDSVVPLWLSMMPADKAADLQRKMAARAGG